MVLVYLLTDRKLGNLRANLWLLLAKYSAVPLAPSLDPLGLAFMKKLPISDCRRQNSVERVILISPPSFELFTSIEGLLPTLFASFLYR